MGRQEYIDYGDRKARPFPNLNFGNGRVSGSYENVGPVTDFVSNLSLP